MCNLKTSASTSKPPTYVLQYPHGVLGDAHGDPSGVPQYTSSKASFVDSLNINDLLFLVILFSYNRGCGAHTLHTSGFSWRKHTPVWETLCCVEIPVIAKPQKQGCEGHMKLGKILTVILIIRSHSSICLAVWYFIWDISRRKYIVYLEKKLQQPRCSKAIKQSSKYINFHMMFVLSLAEILS